MVAYGVHISTAVIITSSQNITPIAVTAETALRTARRCLNLRMTQLISIGAASGECRPKLSWTSFVLCAIGFGQKAMMAQAWQATSSIKQRVRVTRAKRYMVEILHLLHTPSLTPIFFCLLRAFAMRASTTPGPSATIGLRRWVPAVGTKRGTSTSIHTTWAATTAATTAASAVVRCAPLFLGNEKLNL